MISNGFTVDVEDYFQVSAFATQVDPRTWDQFQSRVVPNTERILKLLAEHQVAGTFFVLGWVAERFPDLVRRIAADGHEVGCHSYWHRLIYDLQPEEFRSDLRAGRDVLEQILGKPVTAYRAPSFSVVGRSLWALDILCEEGFRIDSSIFPVRHDRYGIPDAQIVPFAVETASGTLWEFPPTVLPIWGMNLPVGGGGYLRLYPRSVTGYSLKQVNSAGRPFQIYIHPWEVDPDQPRMRGSMRSKFRHYVNLATTEPKLRYLLSKFRFTTLGRTLEIELAKNPAGVGGTMSRINIRGAASQP